MNEAETRAELIDPQLKACGWGVIEGSKILREYNIIAGKIQFRQWTTQRLKHYFVKFKFAA